MIDSDWPTREALRTSEVGLAQPAAVSEVRRHRPHEPEEHKRNRMATPPGSHHAWPARSATRLWAGRCTSVRGT